MTLELDHATCPVCKRPVSKLKSEENFYCGYYAMHPTEESRYSGQSILMSNTFTFTVKFPVGTKVFFGEGNGAWLQTNGISLIYHPRIITDIVQSFTIDKNQVVWYQFNDSHTRPECQIFSSIQEVIDWYLEDLNRQFRLAENRTMELLIEEPRNTEYKRE